MNKSISKPVYYSLLILCIGFGIMESADGRILQASLWLIAGAVIAIIYSYLSNKMSRATDEKNNELVSLLDADLQKQMQDHLVTLEPAAIHFKRNEVCFWYDEAALDYYDGKKGIMYLTNQRLIFDGKDFSFQHPIELVTIKETRNGFEASVNRSRMKFIAASSPLFLHVWRNMKGEGLI